MNTLYGGLSKKIELPKGGLLLIDHEIPDVREWHRPFDPLKHSFDPLKDIDYRKAVALVDAIKAVMPGGENTLTKEDAEYILLEALLSKPRSLEKLIEKSKDPMREKARRMVNRLLLSPVIRKVLCGRTNFTFNPNSVNLARINRAELGHFDSLVLGLLLISQFKGQPVIPDMGFYGRDAHMSLVREGRLIAGVNFLEESPSKLRNGVLLIPERIAIGATVKDAEVLASYERLVPETNAFNDYVAEA
jgi:hypothetical protein